MAHLKNTPKNDLKNHVISIIETIENPPLFCRDCGTTETDAEVESDTCPDCQSDDYGQMSGFDYLTDVLDVEWHLNADKTFKGARILVAFGGPNIWIDTTNNTVDGHWWSDSFNASYADNLGLDEAITELWEC